MRYYHNKSLNELQRRKSNFAIAPIGDSDQPGHPSILFINLAPDLCFQLADTKYSNRTGLVAIIAWHKCFIVGFVDARLFNDNLDVVSFSCFGVRVSVMFHFMFVHYTFSSV